MSIFGILNTLILGPLELLFDVIYAKAYQITENPGIAIIFLSIAVNLLVFPLYHRADALQKEEHQQSEKLKPGIDHINEVFKGDERYMMMQTYYRQNNYKPYYVLKGSVSLFLQIPFFTAAYRYLSGLSLLHGASFGPIADLGMPDNMLVIFGCTFHLLPILMTVFNIISSAIYTRGMPLRSKIQCYGIAIIFLVLLYDAPAGLAFYWMLNNLFSLIKNAITEIPNSRKIMSAVCSLCGFALFIGYFTSHYRTGMRKLELVIFAALLLQIPLIFHLLHSKGKLGQKDSNIKSSRIIFYSCCVFMTILTGLLIPSAIIGASPDEFVELADFRPPMEFITYTLLIAAGFFIVWVAVYYNLFSPQSKNLFSSCMLLISVFGIIDYMFFGRNYGNLSPYLTFDAPIEITSSDIRLNLLVLLAASLCVLMILKFKPDIMKAVCLASCVAVGVMSIQNISGINKASSRLKLLSEQRSTETPSFILDQRGKNVVVIMLDRAISGFLPYLFEENPELVKQFEGFTYYPNTISYGCQTICSTPSLYGGYEYMPLEINKRADESLKDKHNEALKIMPVIFMNEGYDVTVCDAPYANYQYTADLSIFDEYQDIHHYNTKGAFLKNEQAIIDLKNHVITRNLFCFSIFKTVPLLFSEEVYNLGQYNEAAVLGEKKEDDAIITAYTAESPTRSTGIHQGFLSSYYALMNLPYMTKITDSGENTFFSISNITTHDTSLLQEPQFEPSNIVDNTEYEAEHKIRQSYFGGVTLELDSVSQMQHYQSNMAAYIQLGKWFDYLRNNKVWDNTRIIIVSDHGFPIGLNNIIMQTGNPKVFSKAAADPMTLNPLFLVKDFDSHEFKIDNSFMTSADTSLEAFRDLISNPVNPFTGNQITNERKKDPIQYTMSTVNTFTPNENTGNTFDDSSVIITFENQYVFDYDNWTEQ